MRLVSYKIGTEVRAGVLVEGEIIDISRALELEALLRGSREGPFPPELLRLIEERDFPLKLSRALKALEEKGLTSSCAITGHIKLTAPIPRPPTFFAMARNYASHAPPPEEPIYFVKASTCVVGPEEHVIFPRFLDRVDPEAELGVVIGRPCRRVRREEAMDFVLGYTIVNDVSARNIQFKDMKGNNPVFRSKSIETFGPVGPCIVTADEIPDPHALEMTLRVNGEERMRTSTSEMVHKIPETIEAISNFMPLEAGDIIATGTAGEMTSVSPGDLMEITIEPIGTLRNRVVAEGEGK
ncbi:MAG: fumarylacetoacetate hydrolase family protein [Nitrospinota bacterium]